MELPGDVNNSDKFVASFWGELQLWDNLKFKTTYGADLAFWGNDGWIYPYYLGKSNSQTQSSAWSGMNRGYTWQLENVLSYDKTFGQHSVSVILGQSAKKYQGRTLWGKNYNLQSLDPDKANINFGQGTKADQEATGQAQPFQHWHLCLLVSATTMLNATCSRQQYVGMVHLTLVRITNMQYSLHYL